MSCWRAGKNESGRVRPLIVKASSLADREQLLTNTKALKDAGPAYKKIYVRKDVHPAFRREWKRLMDAEKDEKMKPENQGCNIQLDPQRRY